MTTFDPPGPGSWRQLGDHFPGALTIEGQQLFAEAMPDGSAAYMAAYGVLVRRLDLAFVHGHLYFCPVPLSGPRQLPVTPPAAAVWLLSRLHPAFRRRNRAARRALAERPWRRVAETWERTERSGWVARAQALQDEALDGLDDDALAAHLERARALAAAGLRRHFELHGDDLLPVGLLLARGAEWGVPAGTVMSALNGASPLSAGTVTPPDWQLVTGYDLDGLAWCELGATHAPPGSGAAPPVELRTRVPSDAHDEVDELLADARRAVNLRDDNGMVIAAWPMGLLRRAMLEAGRRLRTRLPGDAVELTVAELIGGLRGADRAAVVELAAVRARRRREASALDAPRTLGPDLALPSLDALPRPLGLVGAAQLAVADNMTELDAPAHGVGDRPYTGRALVVDDPNEALDLLEPGDVVITTVTTPAWNVVIAHAGALVTTAGGLLSHAAVIARELGIPALIGAPEAARAVTTGQTVTVDPVTARLTVEPTDAAA